MFTVWTMHWCGSRRRDLFSLFFSLDAFCTSMLWIMLCFTRWPKRFGFRKIFVIQFTSHWKPLSILFRQQQHQKNAFSNPLSHSFLSWWIYIRQRQHMLGHMSHVFYIYGVSIQRLRGVFCRQRRKNSSSAALFVSCRQTISPSPHIRRPTRPVHLSTSTAIAKDSLADPTDRDRNMNQLAWNSSGHGGRRCDWGRRECGSQRERGLDGGSRRPHVRVRRRSDLARRLHVVDGWDSHADGR